MIQGLSGQEIYDILKANPTTRKAFLNVFSVDTIDHAAIKLGLKWTKIMGYQLVV